MLQYPKTSQGISFYSLLAGLTTATLWIGFISPGSAQQPLDPSETLPSGAEAIEDLQINGQDPSLSIPSAPGTTQIQQEEAGQDEREDESLPQEQDTRQQQEDTVQQEEEEQQPVIGVDNPEHAPPSNETPQQDNSDTLQIPF